MEIIVNHAHVFQKEVREDGTISALKETMDVCSIDKAVCFAPFAEQYNDDGRNQNRWLYEQIRNDSSFFAFGTVDFSKNNLKDQTQEIYEFGFDGIKMHPSFQNFKIDDDKACEVYEVAEKYGLPISFHTGVHWNRLKNDHVLLYDEISHRYPGLKICMEHVGGYSFFSDAVAVMCNNRGKIYAGLTSVFDRDANRLWYLGKEKVKDLIWLTDVDQCIFGLDFPYNSSDKIAEAMKIMHECIDEMNLGENAIEKIFGGNLKKMISK